MMAGINRFATLIRKLGEPEHQALVIKSEADSYRSRVPASLIDFWRVHGRGSYKQGSYWICDPLPYRDLIEEIFHEDPIFDVSEMTVVAYDAFGRINIWHPEIYAIRVDLLNNTVFCSPNHSIYTGEKFEADSSISFQLTSFMDFSPDLDEEGQEILPRARAKLGALEPDEIYGFFPALQLGGARRVENLKRVRAPEHMMLLASLQPATLVRLTDPSPGHVYGQTVPVRRIGPSP